MTNGDLGVRSARPDRAGATQNGMTLQTGMAVNGHISMQQGLLRLVGCRDPKACKTAGADRVIVAVPNSAIKVAIG